MSWTRCLAVIAISTIAGYASVSSATEVCPARREQALRYVDVFDGDPAEMASLVPNETTDTKGYWDLGYVYDQGRVVTVRCKYADKEIRDVKLSERVSRCRYKVTRNILKITCR